MTAEATQAVAPRPWDAAAADEARRTRRLGKRPAVVAALIVLGLLAALAALRATSGDGSPRGARTAAPGSRAHLCTIDPEDGAPAINAAITACPDGSTIRFPANRTYHQDTSILVKNRTNLDIDGNGSTFLGTMANDNRITVPSWWLMRSDGIALHNMTIIGNFPDRGAPSPSRGSTTTNSGVILSGGDGLDLHDLTIRDVFGDGVSFTDAAYHDTTNTTKEFPRNVHISRISVNTAARVCAGGSSGTHVWITDSTFERCFLWGFDFEKDRIDDPLGDLHFLRNTFRDWFSIGIVVPVGGPQADPVQGIEIRDNQFLTLPVAGVCNEAVVIGIYQGQYFSDVDVAGNHIYSWKAAVVGNRWLSGAVRDNVITHAPNSTPNDCGAGLEPNVVVNDSPAVQIADNG
jgi:hypothetical protein